jgi:hypothetical protein
MKGICAICGKGGPLSFEHLPPKAAYNAKDVTLFGFDHWLQRDESGRMTGGYPQPKGTGFYAICKECNERTGEWYVPEYAKLVHTGFKLLSQSQPSAEADTDPATKAAIVGLKGVRPLPIVKEIVAMLLAINSPDFAGAHPPLRAFVLDPKQSGLPERYRLYLTLYRGPLARFVGLAVKIDLTSGEATYVTELGYPPFAYALTVDSPSLLSIGEITHWTTARPDDVLDVRLNMIVGFGHTPYPADYRSRAAIQADRAANTKAESG